VCPWETGYPDRHVVSGGVKSSCVAPADGVVRRDAAGVGAVGLAQARAAGTSRAGRMRGTRRVGRDIRCSG